MRTLLIALLLASTQAFACGTVKIAYTDKHTPPYFVGDGPQVPAKPGASVELLAKIVRTAGCEPHFIRMPLPRIRLGLADGSFDLAAVSGRPEDAERFALPLDAAGKLDRKYSVSTHGVVYVRAKDGLPRDLDPMQYFRNHKLGMAHGLHYSATLKEQGLDIDNGAANLERNIEKLLLGRIDGLSVTVVKMDDLDGKLMPRGLVRLDTPVRSAHTWLAANKDFAARHPDQVHKMWNWIAAHASTELRELVKRYD